MFKVSVVIPVRNAEAFIERALDSVLAQSVPVYEIIVVDNFSTDNTLSLLKDYEKNFSNIKILNNSVPGVSGTRNIGIRHSSGHVIGLLDADDFWDREKVSSHLDHFSIHPNCALSFSGAREIQTEDGEPERISQLNNSFTFRDLLLNKFVVHGSASSVFLNRKILNDSGLFDENLDFGEDWDMWLRIGKKYDLCELRETLVTIQKHSGGAQGKRYGNLVDFHRTFSLLFQWNMHREELVLTKLDHFFVPTAASDLLRNWNNRTIWNGDWGRQVLIHCSELNYKKLGLPSASPRFLPLIVLLRWIQFLVKKHFRM